MKILPDVAVASRWKWKRRRQRLFVCPLRLQLLAFRHHTFGSDEHCTIAVASRNQGKRKRFDSRVRQNIKYLKNADFNFRYFNEDDGFLNSQVTETQALHLEEEMPTLSYGQDDAKLEIDDHQSELPALDSERDSVSVRPANKPNVKAARTWIPCLLMRRRKTSHMTAQMRTQSVRQLTCLCRHSIESFSPASHQPLTRRPRSGIFSGSRFLMQRRIWRLEYQNRRLVAAVFLQGQRLESYHDSVMAELRRIGRRPSVSPEPFLLCGYSETGGSYHFEPNQESQNVIWHRPVSEEPVSRSPSLTVEDINEVDLYVPSVESQQYAVISDGLPHMKGDLPLGYA